MKKEFIEKLAALIIASFGFVSALAWNTAIQEIFKKIFNGQGNTITAMLIYAAIITFIAVLVTLWISKVSDKYKK